MSDTLENLRQERLVMERYCAELDKNVIVTHIYGVNNIGEYVCLDSQNCAKNGKCRRTMPPNSNGVCEPTN